MQEGRVVTLAGIGDWDVRIVGEKIVVPGGIETHAHAVANV